MAHAPARSDFAAEAAQVKPTVPFGRGSEVGQTRCGLPNVRRTCRKMGLDSRWTRGETLGRVAIGSATPTAT